MTAPRRAAAPQLAGTGTARQEYNRRSGDRCRGPSRAEPIRPAPAPTALIDSLGQPPLRGQSSAAEHYLAAVIERAASVATALAASAGVLADLDED